MATQPPKMLVWNVRGLNSPARRSAIFHVVVSANPSIVCFQETKVENVSLDLIRQCLGNKFEHYYYLPAVGTRGGILIAWDHTAVTLSNPHTTTNTLTALVQPHGAPVWWLTGVYGPQSDADKVEFLAELEEI